ncbi:TPA: hypothetical protein ACGCO1_002407 [Legionella pneumophila]
MRTRRLFKMIIVLEILVSSSPLFNSCASTTALNSQNDSSTYKGHNTGGIGWH